MAETGNPEGDETVVSDSAKVSPSWTMEDQAMPRSIDLPPELAGLEHAVTDQAVRLGGNTADPAGFERAQHLAVARLQRRIEGYVALGRVASNRNSLPARLVRTGGHT
jgi:hypothetical protein